MAECCMDAPLDYAESSRVRALPTGPGGSPTALPPPPGTEARPARSRSSMHAPSAKEDSLPTS